jgi:hypothetical protein
MVEPGRARMILGRMRFACWTTKTTDTLRICNTYCFAKTKNCHANAPQSYVIRTLPVFLRSTNISQTVKHTELEGRKQIKKINQSHYRPGQALRLPGS